jgi:hypothetical protein
MEEAFAVSRMREIRLSGSMWRAGDGVMESPKRARSRKRQIQPRGVLYTTAPVPDPTALPLYGAYSGPLYQVRKADDTTKDIPVDGPGGFVDLSVQDAFCSGSTCTISILYDQSPNHNDLTKSPIVMWLPNGGSEANATEAGITVSGHRAHGIYVNNPSANVAYRNNTAKGLASGDEPEAMYMVLDGRRYSTICCFDYGNSSTSGLDDGAGTIEALNWGDGSNYGVGTSFEGCITFGLPSDATDDAIQANIVAAGYGR